MLEQVGETLIAVNIELAKRLGVDLGDRRLRLISAMWGSIIMTALGDLSEPGVEWENVGVDGVVSRLEATYAEFMDEIQDAGGAAWPTG